jgi:IrrE N-terminal-like domain
MTDDVLERALAAERAAEGELSTIPNWIWDGASLPVPIETLADSHYGLLVREHPDLCELIGIPAQGHVSGLLMPATREIWINAGEAARAPNRRRFTIGHELGHWVLHCDLGARDGGAVHCRDSTMREEGAVVDRDGSPHLADLAEYPPPELDANQFGAALLMPAALVAAERRAVGDDVDRLAATFNVSTMAMEKRLWFLDEAG